MQVIVGLIILSVLIILHELGHFIMAKLTGIKVLEFSLFMGPRIFGKRIGETEYSIRAIPLGGFVRMEGEEAESNDERAFLNKPVWVRALVIMGGPVLNIIYAIIAIVLFTYMTLGYYLAPVVSELVSGYPAEKAGLQVGDRIWKVDDETIYTYLQLNVYISTSGGKEIKVFVDRKGDDPIIIKPTYVPGENRHMIGIRPTEKSDFLGFIGYGAMQSLWISKMTLQQLGLLLTGGVSADTLTGPVGIVSELSRAAVQGAKETLKDVFARLIYYSALISLSLGILNLLPVPALDGSKLVILGVEAIRGKPIPPKKEAYITMVGFGLLLMLMVYVSINDIRRIIFGQG